MGGPARASFTCFTSFCDAFHRQSKALSTNSRHIKRARPSAPMFIPTVFALDAGPDETPPFDAWYARPDNAPAIPHDSVDTDEAKFVVLSFLASDWK